MINERYVAVSTVTCSRICGCSSKLRCDFSVTSLSRQIIVQPNLQQPRENMCKKTKPTSNWPTTNKRTHTKASLHVRTAHISALRSVHMTQHRAVIVCFMHNIMLNTQREMTYFLLGEFSCVLLQAAESSACQVYERACYMMEPCHTVRWRMSPSWFADAVLSRSDFPFKHQTSQTATATRNITELPAEITAML